MQDNFLGPRGITNYDVGKGIDGARLDQKRPRMSKRARRNYQAAKSESWEQARELASDVGPKHSTAIHARFFTGPIYEGCLNSSR